LTATSARQLAVDISYLGEILEDLGHPLSADLASVAALSKLQPADFNSTSSLGSHSARAIALVARLPFNGKMNCVFRKEIDVHMGSVEITSLNLDVDLHLEKSLDTIVAVVCVGLPFCKDAIKKAISNTIKNEIEKQVPKQMAQQLTQVLQGLTSKLQCPKIHLPSQELII